MPEWIELGAEGGDDVLRAAIAGLDLGVFPAPLAATLRAIRPIATGEVRFARHETRLTGEGAALMLSLDLGWLEAAGRREAVRIVELEVDGAAGPGLALLEQAVAALVTGLGLQPTRYEKAARLAALGRQPLVIVGAGAAGLMAALAARRAGLEGADILLLERNRQPGRKLLASGNGRANISHRGVAARDYASLGDGRRLPQGLVACLDDWPDGRLLAQFEDWGLACREEEGRWYPASLRAESVVSLFAELIAEQGVALRCGERVLGVEQLGDGSFLIACSEGPAILASRLILATGGCAAPALGSDGAGYQFLEQLGLPCTPILPGLVALRSPEPSLAPLAGQRQRATLYGEGLEPLSGELLFAADGLSGIVAMDMASQLAGRQGPHTLLLDLCPGFDDEELLRLLLRRRDTVPQASAASLAAGLLAPETAHWAWSRALEDQAPQARRLAAAAAKAGQRRAAAQPRPRGRRRKRPQAPSPPTLTALPLAALDEAALAFFAAFLRRVPCRIDGTRDFDQAQLSLGGLPLDALSWPDFAVPARPGLHVCGELLDLHGPCGGYNLHLAFVSGWEAGRAAAQALLEVEPC